MAREVWAHNFEEEMLKIREVVQTFPYVAMVSEFPTNRKKLDNNYSNLKNNVNATKLIQLGLTFFDEDGRYPTFETSPISFWQFNFCGFNQKEDLHSDESVLRLFQNKINIRENNEKGIDSKTFFDRFKSFGVMSNNNLHWVTYDGSYDFGFMLKMLTGKDLPENLQEFSEKLKEFFPILYDIKHLANKIGYTVVDAYFDINQAGPVSMFAARTFNLMKTHRENSYEEHMGRLYGLA